MYKRQPLSPYAAVKRDLALVCDEAVACGDIEETIKKASPLITEVKLFDIYRGANLGEGKKSMAFSLTPVSYTHLGKYNVSILLFCHFAT